MDFFLFVLYVRRELGQTPSDICEILTHHSGHVRTLLALGIGSIAAFSCPYAVYCKRLTTYNCYWPLDPLPYKSNEIACRGRRASIGCHSNMDSKRTKCQIDRGQSEIQSVVAQ